jgi:DNA primase
MLYEKMSFIEAVKNLAARAGLTLPASTRTKSGGAEATERTVLFKLHDEAARFYRRHLLEHSGGRRALAYLEERGLSRDTIEERGFGYAPDRWSALLEHVGRMGGKAEDLIRAGLAVPRREGRGCYDRFRNRVMIPIRNESGRIVAFGARLLGPGEPKYLNSSESAIYRKSYTLFDFDRAKVSIRTDDFAILMEGYLDCIQAHQAGIGNAVACCGTSLTAGHARLLSRYTSRVVVNFDPDAAGEAATRRSIDLLIEEGFQVSVLTLPEGEDPDSFIRRRGIEAYRQRLGQAGTFIDYLIESSADRYGVTTPREKAEFLNAVLPTLARIPNHVERVAHVSRLAERAEISDTAVVEELRKKVMARANQVSLIPQSSSSLRPAERDLVRWLLHSPPDAAGILVDIETEDLEDLATAPILRAMKEVVASEDLSTERVMEKLSAEQDRNLLTRIALEPSPLGPRQSPRDCLNRLREQRWRRQLSRLRARLSQGVEDDAIAAEIQTLARRIENLARIEKLA